MILRTVFPKGFYFREVQNFYWNDQLSSSFHTYTELFSPYYTDDDGAYPVSLPLLISAEHLTFLSSDLSRSLYTLPPSNPSLSLRFVSFFWDLTARSSSLTNLFLSPSSLSLVRFFATGGGYCGGRQGRPGVLWRNPAPVADSFRSLSTDSRLHAFANCFASFCELFRVSLDSYWYDTCKDCVTSLSPSYYCVRLTHFRMVFPKLSGFAAPFSVTTPSDIAIAPLFRSGGPP